MVWPIVAMIIVGALTGLAWVWELAPAGRAFINLKKPTSKNPIILFIQCFQFIFGFIGVIFKSWAFVIDIGITYFMTSIVFQMQGSTNGIILGLTISLVFSAAIIIMQLAASNQLSTA